MDVVIVGAGPAGLACAIELARLVKRDQEAGGGMPDVDIGVLEKAESLGEHNLSGAVVNPRAFRELFPELQLADFPFRAASARRGGLLHDRAAGRSGSRRRRRCTTPASTPPRICEIVRWLGERAEALGVNLFAGFPGGCAAGGGRRRARRPHHAVGARPGRAARLGLHRADRSHGAASPSWRKERADPGAGVARSGARSARPTRSSSRSASRSCGR